VSQRWPALLCGWLGLLVALLMFAPTWDSVVEDGEFAFLPEGAPSRVGERLFHEAFPDDMLASSIVIVVTRENRSAGLTTDESLEKLPDNRYPSDYHFVSQILLPQLEKIAKQVRTREKLESAAQENQPLIQSISTFEDPSIGHLLVSEDRKSTLVIMQLTTEFQELRNWPVIEQVESLISKEGLLAQSGLIPPGLELTLSGSALVGRDMRKAAEESAQATETWTVILVLILLIIIYRAPMLAVIPLMTVAMSVAISLSILALLSQAGWLGLFHGIEIYVTVLVYGAGVDYCLFLISRYKEEIDAGVSFEEAVHNSLAKVGATLTASAGTVICGIGMLIFAEFGKFRQAGVGITLSLVVCLLAALTFTPALLRMVGRFAFWPQIQTVHISRQGGWISKTSFLADFISKMEFSNLWHQVGQWLLQNPMKIWLVSIAIMLPFAVIGVTCYNYLTYGLLSELTETAPSVVGTKAVQEHFPAGTTGPVTVVLSHPAVDFSRRTTGVSVVEKLTDRLNAQKEDLMLADIRSVSHPLGGTEGLSQESFIRGKGMFQQAVAYYVGGQGERKNHVTRIDVVFQDDPFSRYSINQLKSLQSAVEQNLPEKLQGSELHFIGPTASIRDLKTTTDNDQIRIDVLVLIGVFLILVVLLGKPLICSYLILSVFFSYLVTLGVTFAVFWALDPGGFNGLDWKVTMFLFTILIAVGEDYNIFLMTRIEEEQQKHGLIKGLLQALEKTGGIISSCGFIMAGTFSSLMAGYLIGMNQLGFALAFGVLLDTFVVRPILVPAFLILLYQGRLGVPAAVSNAETSPKAVTSESYESSNVDER